METTAPNMTLSVAGIRFGQSKPTDTAPKQDGAGDTDKRTQEEKRQAMLKALTSQL